MSGWMQEINHEAVERSLQAIGAIEDENTDLVKLIPVSGLSAEELAAGILRSPQFEQKALMLAISEDERLCAQLRSDQKYWKKMKPQAKFHFLVSLYDDVRCIFLESTDIAEWSSVRIKQVIGLLGARYTETARRAANLLAWLRIRRNDTFLRAIKSVLTQAVKAPVQKAIRESILQRRAHAVARAFYYSRTEGFEKAPSGEDVADWIGNSGKTVFSLVHSPYRRISVVYVDVPKNKQYVEALWLDLGSHDHFFVVTDELSDVDKQGRIRHELHHFCESAFIKIVGE